MRNRLMGKLKFEIEKLGRITIDAIKNIKDEERVEDLLWEAIDTRWELNDTAIEILIRFQPMARELRLVRACMDASYDLYRIVRHSEKLSKLPIDNYTTKLLSSLLPWLKMGISCLTGDSDLDLTDFPLYEDAFNEGLKMVDKAISVHLDSMFNHMKHVLASALYYIRRKESSRENAYNVPHVR
ncbi:phosphate signaling complex PhoU family protein [Pyrococcus abyssi]|uniref:PhoU-like phosphate ABC transporter, regulatory protein n=1 Tax=Pyrococcus abyssi (strain GE5 / Orsay) TaxID=272844 RepID=Q9UZU6_PYRAB|nr:phosphate uptake regulator PhoU [Pyrococcus abyssi]CAB49960.1 phoU-like phosphate ABC transporter, regulatory protein [Pyrococcus abyssi GE5]CCE70459.1 TPA: hypothetical protein PAB0701 [Pyrococcus abyssi GE5]